MFEIYNETNEDVKELDDIKKVLDIAIKKEDVGVVNFNVIVVDSTYIHKLNLEYRGIDRPTDVITFALEDNQDIKYEDFRLLGDIYISLDKAKSQAIEYGHDLRREICFLAVHGFLHLLGYDHMIKEEEEIMFRRQEEILNEAGITK